MIQQIGFKNFRRFENFPMMDLSKVNLLVGTNNSGKSTLVKGLILLLDNLKKMDNFTYYNGESSAPIVTPSFEFDSSLSHDLHIGTFKNALYAGATQDVITFMMKIDDMLVEVDVHGDKNSDETTSSVIRFRLNSEEQGLALTLDFIEHTMNLDVTSNETNKDEIGKLKQEKVLVVEQIDSIRRLLRSSKDPLEIADYNQELKELQNTRSKLNSRIKTFEKEGIINSILSDKIPIQFTRSENSLYGIIKNTAYNASKTIGAKKVLTVENIFQSSLIGEYYDRIRSFVNRFENSIKGTSIEYIYAHAVSQKHILYEHDKNDYLAQTVHQFKKLKVQKGDPLDRSIIESLKKFQIGDDYKITSFEGEAYIVEIHDKLGWTNLANKGMGAIQLFTLELKLNMIYALTKINNFINNLELELALVNENNVWVFIEEPEQNLHPDFQSKLTEEFKKMGENGICCMVETHSEYIIRKSQVLVAQEHYKDDDELRLHNPFAVFYFDKEKDVYPMIYCIDGVFENDFGTGFFDESGKLAFELM